MFDDFFYDKVCTVYTTWYSKVNGNVKETKTEKYSLISCALWKMRSSVYNDGISSRRQNNSQYRINLDGQYTDIKRWDKIEVFHDINGTNESIGVYTVSDFIPYNDVDWDLDNTGLYIDKLDW